MSTKGTILLTEDNEHWYNETLERDNDESRIYIEIDNKNITFHEKDEQGVMIGIKGDSELARMIKKGLYDREDKETNR